MRPRGWRAALRVARRDVLRAKGRNALVVAMVGLPVLGVSTFATVYTTDNISPVEALPQQMGAAQAQVLPVSRQPVDQEPDGSNWVQVAGPDGQPENEEPESPWTPPELQRALGRPVLSVMSTGVSVRTERGRLSAHVVAADTSAPILTGFVGLRTGRLPASDDEALVSPWLAEHGFPIGSRVVVEGSGGDDASAAPRGSARVVGVAVVPSTFDSAVVVAPPGSAAVKAADGDVNHTYLLTGSQPVSWAQVRALNAKGLVVVSRSVVLDPPKDWRSTLSDPEVFSHGGSGSQDRAVLVFVVFSIILEVVLLAGPAFAVGVRRQRRQLALVVAAGGTARDVRRIVLSQALVTGGLASVASAVAGVPLAGLIVWALPRLRPQTTLGPFDVAWLPLIAAAALGAVAAIVAAWFPARSAARQDVVQVLAGRRGQVRSHRGLPVLGVVLLAAGVAAALLRGTRPGGEFWVAGGTLVMVLGAIALLPAVVGAVGRLGRRLPLGLRLAARDSARQRGRTAPAVAAVMAAVAGVTTLAIGASSDFAQSRADYRPRLPSGVTTLQAGEVDAAWWSFAGQTVAGLVPGRHLLPTGELGRTHRMSSWQPGVYVRPPGCPAVPETPDTPPRCTNWQFGGASEQTPVTWNGTTSVVAEPATLAALGYHLSAAQVAVLEQGGVLVPSAALIDRTGHARLTTYETNYADDRTTVRDVRTVRLPAAALAPHRENGLLTVVGAIVTPETASAAGLAWAQNGGVLSPSSTPLSRDAQDRLEEVLRGSAQYVEIYTERGFDEKFTLPLIGLIVIATLAVLVGTLTATGLALVDGRPDAATLAAVGARPRTRRTMAAAQAVVIGLLGSLTGIAVGVVPGLAVTWPLTAARFDEATGGTQWSSPIIDVPWLLLTVVGIGVPLLAAAVAGLGVRSRLPMTRRLGQ
ncbi:MAG: FtsX-like permease family protein [Angustibacter sp.]